MEMNGWWSVVDPAIKIARNMYIHRVNNKNVLDSVFVRIPNFVIILKILYTLYDWNWQLIITYFSVCIHQFSKWFADWMLLLATLHSSFVASGYSAFKSNPLLICVERLPHREILYLKTKCVQMCSAWPEIHLAASAINITLWQDKLQFPNNK